MTIDAGVSVGMVDIDSIAKTILVDGQTADIAVGNGTHMPPLAVLCLDVESAMKVPGARFTEVARQENSAVNGTLVFEVRGKR